MNPSTLQTLPRHAAAVVMAETPGLSLQTLKDDETALLALESDQLEIWGQQK